MSSIMDICPNPRFCRPAHTSNPDQEHVRNQYVNLHYTKLLSGGVINNAAFNFVRTKQTVQDTACGERCGSTLYSQLQAIPGHSLSEVIVGGGEIAQIGALPQYPANYYMNNYKQPTTCLGTRESIPSSLVVKWTESTPIG